MSPKNGLGSTSTAVGLKHQEQHRHQHKHEQLCMYLYYGPDKCWWVSTEEDMRQGRAAGWLSCSSAAATPDKIGVGGEGKGEAANASDWQVDDGTGWVEAPKVKVRSCSAEEKAEVLRAVAEEERLALAQAKEVGDIVVEGQGPGEHQHGCMGVYELVDPQAMVVNGRGVWRAKGSVPSRFLYYSFRSWWVCIGEKPESGIGCCTGW